MKKLFISVVALAMSMMAMAAETAYVQIRLTGITGGVSNSVYLTEDDAYTNAYESGADAEKIMDLANSNSVLMYGFVGALKCGDVVALNLDGFALGFTTNMVDTDYKLTFKNVSGRELTLYDRVTKTPTVITNNGTYNFSVEASQVGQVQINDRFVINYEAPAYVIMKGDFATPGGEWAYTTNFTDNGTNFSLNLDLAADTWYHFQLEEGYSPAIIAADGSSFDRDNNSHNLPVDGWHSALLLHADVAGTYTFTWYDLTDNLTITFPAAPAPTCTTVRSGMVVDNYYTICLPKAVTVANGASFWNMSNRGAGVAYLEEAVLPLVAGRPYIIQAEDAELCVEYSGDEVAAGYYGALHGTLAPMDQAALNAAGSDIYLLKDNELRLVSGQTGNSLAANRAYIKYGDLVYSTPSPAPGRRVRAIPMQDQSTTGVENLNAAEAPVKTVIDGKMYILRGEHMFDATGRMVK